MNWIYISNELKRADLRKAIFKRKLLDFKTHICADLNSSSSPPPPSSSSSSSSSSSYVGQKLGVCVYVCDLPVSPCMPRAWTPPVVANCPSSLRVSPRPDPPRHRPSPLRSPASRALRRRRGPSAERSSLGPRDRFVGSQWRHNPHTHWRDR